MTAPKNKAASSAQTGTEPPKKSVSDHSEHPENPADSTVKHTGAGFPQGEGDVTEPAKAGAKAPKAEKPRSIRDQHLLALAAGQDVKAIEAALKEPNATRLSPIQRAIAAELLPIGAIIEHEGANRWRVRGPMGQGGPHFGHGATMAEAIDSFVLGNVVATDAEASAHRFSKLPPKQQKEIEERDIASGNQADVDARRKTVEAVKKSAKLLDSPINAQSDGAAVGSELNAEGKKAGDKAGAEKNRTRAAGRTRSKAKATNASK